MLIAWQGPCCSDAVVDLLLWLLRGQRERGEGGGGERTKRRTRGRINMKKRRIEKE